MDKIIKMQKFRKPESRMFSGREFGLQVRKELELNNKDKDKDNYIIQIPDDIMAINSSFFGGLFSESVLCLGEEDFLKKYVFQNEKNKALKNTLQKDIREGIYDTLNS